ncbi:MAG: segregation/condensation protein A [Alphaproteobacteria bacterium]|nr:segregation/condensation protein A [Alphaproteobacteria bacterium]
MSGGAFVLDIEGYEGPIDVLLALAREQKVDLVHVSILQLAEQFLEFVSHARRHQLELAADYLVMAAWLAYLKSRLLLPVPRNDEEPSGEEMAAALQFQLRRLEAMQEAGRRLMERPRLGRDFFARGAPEALSTVVRPVFDVTLHDLLRAYGEHRRRTSVTTLEIIPSEVYSVESALQRLGEMLGRTPDWTTLSHFLPEGLKGPFSRRSALCATLIASLELARQGKLSLRQDGGPYSPIYLRGAS